MKPLHHTDEAAARQESQQQRQAAEPVDSPPPLSAERAKAIMDERARILAQVPAQPPSASELLELVTFTLGKERYAIETHYVREVISLAFLTPIPAAPDLLAGVTNLRGEILAVIDLGKCFGIAARGLTDLPRVVVLGGDRAEFGILADTAHEVSRLRTEEVLQPPGSLMGAGREYLRGVTKDALIVLNGAMLLQDARLFIDQSEERSG